MPEGLTELLFEGTRLIFGGSGHCVRGISRTLRGSLVAYNHNSDLEEALSSTLAGYDYSSCNMGN